MFLFLYAILFFILLEMVLIYHKKNEAIEIDKNGRKMAKIVLNH